MANRYWVGGTGTWNTTSTTNWSATSGGASGASVPTAADSVFFDQAGTYTVTMTGALLCLDFTVSAGTVTFATGTGPTLAVSGSMSLAAATVWNSTGTITFNATSSKTITTNGVSLAAPSITFNGVGGTWQLQDNLTCSATNKTCTLTNGTLDINSKTLTCGTFSSSNSNTRTIAFGTGNITLSGGTNNPSTTFATVTNLTFTGTPLIVVASNAGGSNAPSIQTGAGAFTNMKLNVNGTCTLQNSTFLDITVGAAITLTAAGNINVYGNLTLFSGMTLSATAGPAFVFSATSGTKTITTAGVNFGTVDLTLNGVGGTFQLQDAITGVGTITLTNGTFDANNFNVSGQTFSSSNTNTRTLALGSGTWTMSGLSAWTCTTSTNLTITGTATISLTRALAKTFAGGGKTWPTLQNAGAGALTITGSNTFTTIKNSVQPTTFTFTAGTTQTVTNFTVSGTAGNLVTLNSTVAGTAATLSKSSGTVSCDYLSIQDSTATGGAAWYAGANSTNVSGNTGWIFTAAPVNFGQFLMFMKH